MVIWKGWSETVPCRATLNTPFPALCPKILGTRFTNYGLRMFWGELMVIWKRWFETVPCRATLNTPFPALCPKILGTRFTNYGLRVSGEGAPQFLEKRFLPQKEANEELRGSPGQELRGSQKQGTYGRVPSQPCKSPGSFAAHETLLLAERAVWGSFSKHFRKPSHEKSGLRPGSFAVLRVSQKEAKFAKIACFEPRFRRKNAIQKCAKKVAKSHLPFRRKNDFFA